jgi:hypothetical protein
MRQPIDAVINRCGKWNDFSSQSSVNASLAERYSNPEPHHLLQEHACLPAPEFEE